MGFIMVFSYTPASGKSKRYPVLVEAGQGDGDGPTGCSVYMS